MKSKYLAIVGEYNRCFGEAPDYEITIEASDLEEAKIIAHDSIKGSNPDTYIRRVEFKENMNENS